MFHPTKTECSQGEIEFQGLENRRVIADFEGGYVTSDAGLLLLRETDLRFRILKEAAKAFQDKRNPDLIEHTVEELLRQRVLGIAAGYEDLNDHDRLRHDPLMALVAGKGDPTGSGRRRKRDRGKACAGKSTLNRLELSADLPVHQAARYHKITYNPQILDELLVEHMLSSYREVPDEIVLDLDATDDPLHGCQEMAFFHGYYGNYCYLPLYIFCGDFLLCARLRPSNQDASAGWEREIPRIIAQIRKRWPKTRIILRADSGFARDLLMTWCEQNGLLYAFGLARNERLQAELSGEMAAAEKQSKECNESVRCWKDFQYRTRKSWRCSRRVIGKAEWLIGTGEGKPNPRFVVTNIDRDRLAAQPLYEKLYCERGEMENRIKEQQQDLFADRTSTGFLASNQLRLYLSSLAYLIINAMRWSALRSTSMAQATAGTIRAHLIKAGAVIRISVRRVLVSISTGWPAQELFRKVAGHLCAFG